MDQRKGLGVTSAASSDILVIGAGPAGYVAAIRGAQLGFRVTVIEKQALGGTCLNVGCIPSKALLESSELYAQTQHTFKDHGIVAENVQLDLKKMMARKDRIVKQLTGGIGMLFKKNKIEHVIGVAKLTKEKKVEVRTHHETFLFSASHIILATGSVPIELPTLPFDGNRIIDSTTALSLVEIPKTLTVVGGGYIGLEMGSVFARLGAKVTVVEALDRVTPAMDVDISLSLKKILEREGITFRLSTKVQRAQLKKDGVDLIVHEPHGKESIITSDKVLVAIGRRACTDELGLEHVGIATDPKGRIEVDETWTTNVSGIYAVGDVIAGPMLAHKASEEGMALVETIAGHAAAVNFNAIPAAVYTYPEAACVGLTEEEAKSKGIHYAAFRFPLMANGRALSMGERDGFVKLIADKETGKLIGGHILAPRASDMIAELTLGLEFSATAEDLALTCHAHPTLAEAVKEAALGLTTGTIHL